MKNENIYKIQNIYFIKDKGYIIAHIKEREWELSGEHNMKIVSKGQQYNFRYIGFGNVNGMLALKLTPLSEIDLRIFDEIDENDIYMAII